MKNRKSGKKTFGLKPKGSTGLKMNPFEVHINKSKHQVIGKKSKNTVGFPGIARHKAIQKRKVTLLQEYKVKDKANKFFDKRIGERNSAMTADDRIMARFTAERIKDHKTKRSVFNLDDDAEIDVLTHKGRTLEEIEKFDDPRSDEEDNDDDGLRALKSGNLDADFVGDAHFGGGLLSKSNEANNHQDLIEKLILESKKRKAEKMMNKEKTLELTQKLDATWKELIPLVSQSAPLKQAETEETEESCDGKKKNSYDVALRQLKFEARGLPTDKLKSEEEIIREEKERLESLEAERLQRMQGIDKDEIVKKPKHVSADDLDDCFYDSDNDTETLAYNNEGRPISGILKKLDSETNTEHLGMSDELSGSEIMDEGEEDEAEEDADEEAVENEDDSDSSEDSFSDLRSDSREVCFSDSRSDSSSDDDSNNDEEKSTNLQKTKSPKKTKQLTSESNEEENVSAQKTPKRGHLTERNSSVSVDDDKPDSAKKVRFGKVQEEPTPNISSIPKVDQGVFSEILKRKKLLMEKARKELPYTFKAPENYEELEKVLVNRSAEEKAIIIERMIKCNHPSLLESNKEKLKNLFAFLLQHLNDATSSNDLSESWSTLDALAPYLYDLCQFSPDNAGNCIKEVIKEKQSCFRKSHRSYPNCDTLLFLKLVSLLFPTSDLFHPVVTPCIIFILQILHQCWLESRKDIASALFLVVLILEFTELSKRYTPEVMSVLQAIICMASPNETVKVSLPGLPNRKILLIQNPKKNKRSSEDREFSMKLSDLNEQNSQIDDDFKLRVLSTTLTLITQFAYRFNSLPASPVIFAPLKNILSKLEIDNYSSHMSTLIDNCKSALETAIDKKLEVLSKAKEKPKILKLYEPKIVQVYDMKFMKEKEDDPKAEHVKLLRSYRKEMKGAMREIRRDKDFISRVKFKEQEKSDSERRRKVKELYSWGATQQGELNQTARKKKKH